MLIFKNESMDFLKKYIDTPSPSGFEAPGQKVWMEYMEQFVDEFITDAYGSVAGVINPDADYKIMLEAHADEIGWIVSNIGSGVIYPEKIGGSDHQIAPSKVVNIHTKKGVVKGVFGWTAVHIRDSKTTPSLENLFIDVGVGTEKEVKELGIAVGDPITFDDGLEKIGKNRFFGRAVDNKIGGFIMTQVARALNNKKLPFGVYFVNAVQEEVGKNGATTMTRIINPDVALVTDVSHDTTSPGISTRRRGSIKLGNGPVVTIAPAINKPLLEFVEGVAAAEKIDLQYKVGSKTTGTDTDVVAFTGRGVPSVLVSTPIRYMHTTSEMFHTKDVRSLIDLYTEVILKLKPGQSFDPVSRRAGKRGK